MWIRFMGLLGLILSANVSAEISRMSGEELAIRLDDATIVVLDVRKTASWRFSDQKIKHAVRVDSHDIPKLSARYDKDTTLVLYCD